jgi:hypothetical protein
MGDDKHIKELATWVGGLTAQVQLLAEQVKDLQVANLAGKVSGDAVHAAIDRVDSAGKAQLT